MAAIQGTDGSRSNLRGEGNWFILGAVAVAVGLWLLWVFVLSHLARGWYEGSAVHRSSTAVERPITASASFVVKPQPAASGTTAAQLLGSGTIEIKLPQEAPSSLPDLGLSGDAFGGFNALAAALACLGVFWAALLQRRTLREVRNSEAATDRARRFEQTRGMFFEMLALARELAQRIQVQLESQAKASRRPEIDSDDDLREGDAALDSMAYTLNRLAKNWSEEERLQKALVIYQKYYDGQPSRMGPYFRLLFQIFKLIDSARIEPSEKLQLSNIARGQISEGAVLMLALNALTWRGWNFARYVEDYGLLEHMHHQYKTTFGSQLLRSLDESAFLGSDERTLRRESGLFKRGDPTQFDTSDEAAKRRQDWRTAAERQDRPLDRSSTALT